MKHTDAASDRLVRLPLWPDLGKQQQTVIDAVMDTVPRLRARGIAA
jgi:dTDP-4-amino-4,6-dideoxygalactose transaminase